MIKRSIITKILAIFVVLFGGGQLFSQPLAVRADGYTIDGTVYDVDSNQWDCASTNVPLKIEVNGGPSKGGAEYTTLCVAGDGAYTIGGIALSGYDRVTVFADTDDYGASYFIKFGATPGNRTIDLIQDANFIQNLDDGSVSNSDLDIFDHVDNSRIPYTISGTQINCGATLGFVTGTSYVANGTVTGNPWLFIQAGATVTLEGESNAIGGADNSGSLIVEHDTTSTGGFYSGGGAINFSSGTTLTITGGIWCGAPGCSFYDVVTQTSGGFTNNTGNAVFHNLSLIGDLSAGTGSFTCNNLTFSSGTRTFSGSGVKTITGTLTIPDGVSVSINDSLSVGRLTTEGTGSVTYTGTPTLSVSGATLGGGSGDQSYYNLQKTGAGETRWTGSGVNSVDNVLSVTDGTFVADTSFSTGTVTESGGIFSNVSGTVTITSLSDVTFSASGGVNNLVMPNYDGTVGHWRLDETTGTSFTDSSFVGLGGNYVGSVTQLTPPPSTNVAPLNFNNPASLSFPGPNNNYAGVTSASKINSYVSNKLTVTAWIKPTDFAQWMSFVYGQKSSGFGWNLWSYTQHLTFRINTKVLDSNENVLTAGTWQFIAGTYDGTLGSNNMILYVNGHTYTATGSGLVSGISSITIGCTNTGTECAKGAIDDARVYNRVLSADEIATLAAGNELTITQPVISLGADLNVNGNLTINSATLNANGHQLTVEQPLVIDNSLGRYNGSTATQNFNGGVSVSAGTFIGSSGTTNITGAFTQTGGSVTTGAGTWNVSGDFTPAGSGFTITSGHTLVMNGAGTLTSGGQNFQNLTINPTGTIVLGDASDTVTGNLLIGTNGTLSSGTTAITMTGNNALLAGGNKIVYDLTLTGTTTTLQTSDLTVSHALTVSSGRTLALNTGRALALSAASGTSLTMSGATISGAGTLIYRNSATTFPTNGTISAGLRLDMVNVADEGNSILPYQANGYGPIELYNATANDVTVLTNSSSAYVIHGGLTITAGGVGHLNFDVTASGLYNPAITIDGDLLASRVSTRPVLTTGAASWSIGGDVNFSNVTYTAGASNTLIMTGVGKNIYGGGQTLVNLTINPVSAGTVNLTGSDITVSNTLTVAGDDTFTLDSERTLTNNGTLTLNGALAGDGIFLTTTGTIGTSGTFNTNLTYAINAGTLVLPTRTYYGSSHTVKLLCRVDSSDECAVDFGSSASSLTIEGNLWLENDSEDFGLDVFATSNNQNVSIGGNLTSVNWTALEMGSGTWTVGGNFDLSSSWISPSTGTLIMTGSEKTLNIGANQLNNLTTSGNVRLISASTILGNISVSAGTLTAPTGNLTIGGSFDNDGNYAANGGTLIFNATSTGRTIDPGVSSFNNLTFSGAAGGWTITGHDLVVTGNFNLTTAAAFTVQSGRTIEVNGAFRNAVGGNATTWTGSTLYLNGQNANDAINTKTGAGDSYATIRLGAAEHAYLWNSDAATISAETGGSLVSQNQGGVSGLLHVYGAAASRSNEYWSVSVDFDGATLGTARTVAVKFADDASMTVDAGDALYILGAAWGSGRAGITHLGTGTYGVVINGTLSARYFTFDSLNPSGLVINSGANVIDLSSGVFDSSVADSNAAYITVNGATSTATFNDLTFDAENSGVDTNTRFAVSANGAGINWTFVRAAGLKIGSTYAHALNGARVAWDSPTLTINDGDGADSDYTSVLTQLSANWNISPTTNLAGFVTMVGTTPGGSDVYGPAPLNQAMYLILADQSLTDGMTYYVTVLARNLINETMVQNTSDGILADATAPSVSALQVVTTSTTATVSWITDESTISRIDYGLTLDYGSAVAESTTAVGHSLDLTNLRPNKTYHLKVTDVDLAGNTAATADIPFSTKSVTMPKLNRPIITDRPTPTITISGTALVGQRVNIYLDGKLIKRLTITGRVGQWRNFSWLVSLATIKSGSHTIKVISTETNGAASKSQQLKFTLKKTATGTTLVTNKTAIYLVRPGDSLWRLARAFLGQGQKYVSIVRINAKTYPSLVTTPGVIIIGWLLKI